MNTKEPLDQTALAIGIVGFSCWAVIIAFVIIKTFEYLEWIPPLWK